MGGGGGRLGHARLYKELLDNLVDGVCLVDADGRVTYWNHGAERLTGLPAPEVLTRRCCTGALQHLDARAAPVAPAACPLALTLDEGQPREVATWRRRADGHRLPVLAHVSPVHDRAGRLVGAVEVFSDNSAAESALTRLAELQQLALLDSLTAIGNRRFVEMQLVARLDTLQRYGWPFGVLFMDLDEFKSVNDRYGHAAGDQVLRLVARTLTGAVRSFDVVGRWGGDEFVAVVSNVTEAQLAAIGRKLERLVGELRIPLLAAGAGPRATLAVSLSVGASRARPGETLEGLVGRADEAMFRTKTQGHLRVATH